MKPDDNKKITKFASPIQDDKSKVYNLTDQKDLDSQLASYRQQEKAGNKTALGLPIKQSGAVYNQPKLEVKKQRRFFDQFHSSPSHPAPKSADTNVILPLIPARKKSKRKLKLKLPQLSRKQVIVGLVCIALVALGGYQFFYKPKVAKLGPPPVTPSVTTDKIIQKPNYPTVLPYGKTIEQLGGWKKGSPPGRDPYFAYSDKIGDVKISVTQQPLPQDFKQDSASAIEKLAKGYHADEKLTVGNIVAYLGTSGKGPQSLIFAKNNLLILIVSTDKLTTQQWADYISSLA